jgi:hypothetical protein
MDTDDTTHMPVQPERADQTDQPGQSNSTAEGQHAGAVPRDGRDVPQHVERMTLADEEMEHIREKSESGDVLDPLALEDPSGRSVERVVVRVGLVVVLILVVGILFVQVACKNMQLSGVANFSEGTTEASIDKALSHGVLFGGEIVSFPAGAQLVSYDEEAGVIEISYEDDSARTIDQVLASVQSPTMALAMSAFEDPNINTVKAVVSAHVDEETGEFSGKSSDPIGEVFTITWTRDYADPENYSCTISGYVLPPYAESALSDSAESADASDSAA